MTVELNREQQATIARERCPYSLGAKLLFCLMDGLAGRKMTLGKAKLIETLASIPYRAWEIRQYACLTRRYRNAAAVQSATAMMTWAREAQDNEYFHLLVINEKMKEDGAKDPWYLFPLVPFVMVCFYTVLTRVMALISIRRALLFNAEFEDHAEHEYARFVSEHPEWEQQPVHNEKVRAYADLPNWADIFRRIGLDERDHMNNSFILHGKPECVVEYEGMPGPPDRVSADS